MATLPEPRFDASDQAAIDAMRDRLRAQGWASHVTVPGLLRTWRDLAISVNRYRLTVDDYTNDVTARDGLEIVLAACEEPFRTKLRCYVDEADAAFVARTEEDVGALLGRHFLIDESSGWWWRRRPIVGPLAAYLRRSAPQ
jgi:hypothetical protein